MLDPERACTLDEPVHRRTIEVSRATETVRAREPSQQLEIDLLRETTECAVADVARLVIHAWLQVVRDESDHLAAHVESIHRVHVQSIEDAQRRFDARLL